MAIFASMDMQAHRKLDDDVFIELFEQVKLPSDYLSHEAHFRLAYLYFETYPFKTALRKITDGIRRFDRVLGDGTKYHETITQVYARLVFDRMCQTKGRSWTDFMQQNRDLLRPVRDVMSVYYSTHLWQSDEAKRAFVLPDLKALPPETFDAQQMRFDS